MKVTSKGGDSRKYINYGEIILKNEEHNELFILGQGAAISKVVCIAERIR